MAQRATRQLILRLATEADMAALKALAAHPDVEPMISMASEAALGSAARSDHQEVLVIECPAGERVARFASTSATREGQRRRAYWRHGAWQDTVLFALVAEGGESPR